MSIAPPPPRVVQQGLDTGGESSGCVDRAMARVGVGVWAS